MSESVPRPESLVQRTIEVLRAQIGEGRFGDTLPGEPRLASQLMVSRGTLRKALDGLAGEKWISGSVSGKPRRMREVTAAHCAFGTAPFAWKAAMLPQILSATPEAWGPLLVMVAFILWLWWRGYV